MTCPQENKNVTKQDEKRTKYRQLAIESRGRRAEYKTYVIPIVIRTLGGGIKEKFMKSRK